MNFRVHSLLYFGTGITFIALETIGAIYPGLVVKAFIIPILIWLYMRFIKGDGNSFHRLILFALVFSWVGDMTLQLTSFNETFFLVGLSSFLIAHILYLIGFFATRGKGTLFFKRIYLVLPIILYGWFILWFLGDGLGDMKLPVSLYTIIILAMLLAAISRDGKVNRQSYVLVFLGALLFVLSDSLIALNKFKESFDLARIAIMTSYITAQYLIAIGCLRQYNLTLKN